MRVCVIVFAKHFFKGVFVVVLSLLVCAQLPLSDYVCVFVRCYVIAVACACVRVCLLVGVLFACVVCCCVALCFLCVLVCLFGGVC